MQLILVQSEVEQAIKDYVGKLINIGPNTQVDIDLTATRGSEGVKAVIELTTKSDAPFEPSKADQAPVATGTGRGPGRPRKVTTPAPEPTPEPESVVEETPEPGQDEPETASEAPTDTETESDTTEAVEEAPAPPATPATAPRSLFANLRKPQNS